MVASLQRVDDTGGGSSYHSPLITYADRSSVAVQSMHSHERPLMM